MSVRCRHCGWKLPSRERAVAHLFEHHPQLVAPLVEPFLETCPPFPKRDEGPPLFDRPAYWPPRLTPVIGEYDRHDDLGDMAIGFHEITIEDLRNENWETQRV